MKPSSTKSFRYNRRSFLGAASTVFSFNFIPSHVFGANQRLQIAGIGVGGKGRGDFDGLARHGEVVAACDIDSRRLELAVRKHPQADKFSDYREMLSELGSKIDAITVCTADHTHAPATMMAMEQGIHVYVQKPLTHTVWEARQLAVMARKKKICTQMGNQGTASDGIREGAEYLQAGGIGSVQEIHAWTNRPVWPQAPQVTKRPSEKMVPPRILIGIHLSGLLPSVLIIPVTHLLNGGGGVIMAREPLGIWLAIPQTWLSWDVGLRNRLW